MKGIFTAGVAALALALSPMTMAEEAAAPAAPAADAVAAPAGDAAAPVSLTASGDHAVVVNTGNESVDAAANYAAKCTERAAAMKSCDAMGGFKAMGCRKMAEMRYKSVTNCPNL